MNYENLIIKAKDGYELSARLFESESPKAVIKFIHGMEEHKERYDAFASFLQTNGYTILTSDMRGHGENAPLLSHIADKNGHKLLIEDEQVMIEFLKEKYPDQPLYLFGHSMGTIIARKLLQTNSNDFRKTALSGYPNPQGIAGVGAALASFIALFKGKKGHSKLLNDMVVGAFNKTIENPRTNLDWLSYNEENVDRYINDPLSGVEFTIASFNALFHLVGDINKPKLYKDVNTEMPIYLISGIDDPCAGGEKGRADSLDRLSKAGFKNIEVKTIDNMRHEILNETHKEEVYNLILEFFNK